jgi:hypothetical protein
MNLNSGGSGPPNRAQFRFSNAPFMTESERAEFKRLRDAGAVTLFGISECAAEGCEREVPKAVKLFCSKACWTKEEGAGDGKEEGESGAMD